MFTPKLSGTRSKYSSFSTPVTPGRDRSAVYSASRKKFTPSKKTGLNTSVANTSCILVETGSHRLESCSTNLPLLVTENLALRDKKTACSVRLDGTGWAWLVCGRKLLMWHYGVQQAQTSACHALSLPPSSIASSTDLVALVTHSNTLPGCVAVSAEGTLRYWANISHDTAFTELSVDTRGQQCTHIAVMQNMCCVVGTATSGLYHITLGQGALRSRSLTLPHNMLSGFGRRMSSFIFGGGPVVPEATLHEVLAGEVLEGSVQALYVLTGSSLQKWAITPDADRFLYQCNMEGFVRDCFAENIWGQDASKLANLQTWLLHMQTTRDGVVVLCAGVNTDVSNSVCYALGTLHTEGQEAPQSFLSFNVLRHQEQCLSDGVIAPPQFRLLLPNMSSSTAILYSNSCVLCASLSTSQPSIDRIDFQASGDSLLGAGSLHGAAMFFSNTRGIVTIRESVQSDASLSESMMENAPPPLDISVSMAAAPGRLEEMSMSDDNIVKMKAAFLHCCRRNMTEAQALVDELFPPGLPDDTEAGGALDVVITDLSVALIDDCPAPDPRWAEANKTETENVGSLLLIHQLQEKLRAHELLIDFLKKVHLWERLGTVPVRDAAMVTRLLLCEHAEKVISTKALREVHTQCSELVDTAIRRLLTARGIVIPPDLSPRDVFYREVSRVDELVASLLVEEEEALARQPGPRALITLISQVNTLITAMLSDALQYRQTHSATYQSSAETLQQPDYLPWTATEGPQGMRSLLLKQHEVTVGQALGEAAGAGERGGLLQQLMELTEAILGGYTSQINSIKCSQGYTQHYNDVLVKYESTRAKLLNTFMEQKQYERATSLAEKFEDYNTLVSICEQTDNQERLQRYLMQYENRGFAEFVFKWYVDKGLRGKLMTSSLASHPQLSSFLHGTNNKFMSWVHDIGAQNYQQAHTTLMSLAGNEEKSMAKKKTLLSLSKLAALASDDMSDHLHNNIQGLNEELDLILNQEQLPQDVIEALGLDPDSMRVLSPKELIELYVCEHNCNSNEFDFKKALDLLRFIDQDDPDVDQNALLLHIWCRAILKDNWCQMCTDDPLDTCRETVFFKTVELRYTSGQEVLRVLPPVDTVLQCEELGVRRHDNTFKYRLRAAYEHIIRTVNSGVASEPH